MPVVVKFILQSVTPRCAAKVVATLRENLDLDTLGDGGIEEKDVSATQWGRRDQKIGESVTLDAIKSGIRFQKITSDAWLKAILAPVNASAQKPLDLFVLLMVYDMPGWR
jgi:Fanconi anemia group D2 protein